MTKTYEPITESASLWATPKGDVTVHAHDAENMQIAINGLGSLLDVISRNEIAKTDDESATLNEYLHSGLLNAARALTLSLSNQFFGYCWKASPPREPEGSHD
jgi:hypothetical protein